MNRPLWRPSGSHRRTPEAWAEMTAQLTRLTAERDALTARITELESRQPPGKDLAVRPRRMPVVVTRARFQPADLMQGARATKAAA